MTSQPNRPNAQPKVPITIDVGQVRQRLEDGERVLLLDCREAAEVALCRIDGAEWIPLAELPDQVEKLANWRDGAVVVYCHHGVRSLRAARWLRGQGFGHAQSMSGGIDAWSILVDPSIARYGPAAGPG